MTSIAEGVGTGNITLQKEKNKMNKSGENGNGMSQETHLLIESLRARISSLENECGNWKIKCKKIITKSENDDKLIDMLKEQLEVSRSRVTPSTDINAYLNNPKELHELKREVAELQRLQNQHLLTIHRLTEENVHLSHYQEELLAVKIQDGCSLINQSEFKLVCEERDHWKKTAEMWEEIAKGADNNLLQSNSSSTGKDGKHTPMKKGIPRMSDQLVHQNLIREKYAALLARRDDEIAFLKTEFAEEKREWMERWLEMKRRWENLLPLLPNEEEKMQCTGKADIWINEG